MEVHDGTLAGPAPEGRSEVWRAVVAAALPSLRLTNGGACEPHNPGTRLGGEPLVGPGFV